MRFTDPSNKCDSLLPTSLLLPCLAAVTTPTSSRPTDCCRLPACLPVCQRESERHEHSRRDQGSGEGRERERERERETDKERERERQRQRERSERPARPRSNKLAESTRTIMDYIK